MKKLFAAFLKGSCLIVILLMGFVTIVGSGGGSTGGPSNGGSSPCGRPFLDYAPRWDYEATGGSDSCRDLINDRFDGMRNTVDSINGRVTSYNNALSSGQCSAAEDYLGQIYAISNEYLNQCSATRWVLVRCDFPTEPFDSYCDDYEDWHYALP